VAKATQISTPMATYDVLSDAFAFFNKELFGGKLSNCLIILHRHRSYLGYFHASHMAGKDASAPVHEIALNPQHIRTRKPRETLSTLVHEMVHQRQQEHGKPPKNAYHNKQWAAFMKEVGLYPSDTAKKGGAETGKYVSHYIVEGGPFALAFAKFEKKQKLDLFGDLPAPDKKKVKSSKFKFECAGQCGQVCWGKEGLTMTCAECDEPMELAE